MWNRLPFRVVVQLELSSSLRPHVINPRLQQVFQLGLSRASPTCYRTCMRLSMRRSMFMRVYVYMCARVQSQQVPLRTPSINTENPATRRRKFVRWALLKQSPPIPPENPNIINLIPCGLAEFRSHGKVHILIYLIADQKLLRQVFLG